MFNNLKKCLYETKMYSLLMKGLNNGLIVEFEDELYEKMSHTYFNGLPISIRFKYLDYNKPKLSEILPGRCMDNSLLIFFCLEDAFLVCGDVKNLEYLYGKENAIHFWVEKGDFVYEPTARKRYDKKLFYEVFQPTNIKKCTLEEWYSNEENKKYYERIVGTTLEDMQPNGRERVNLITIIPLFQEMAKTSNNQDFINELNAYLNSIQYDEIEIFNELNHGLFRNRG